MKTLAKFNTPIINKQKDYTFYGIPFISHSEKGKTRETEGKSVVARVRMEGIRGLIGLFPKDRGDGCIMLCFYQNTHTTRS